jgi:hypothetical protein
MKKILEQPKIIVYENVEKITDILNEYDGMDMTDSYLAAEQILQAFNIPLGKRTELKMFENNVQATLVTNKKGIAKIVISLAK